jgi:hypothetical protein
MYGRQTVNKITMIKQTITVLNFAILSKPNRTVIIEIIKDNNDVHIPAISVIPAVIATNNVKYTTIKIAFKNFGDDLVLPVSTAINDINVVKAIKTKKPIVNDGKLKREKKAAISAPVANPAPMQEPIIKNVISIICIHHLKISLPR